MHLNRRETGMAKKWKCTVCGYIHEGEQPPEECPRCGAPRAQFIPLEEERVNLLHDLIDTFMLHPVAVHFPNGLIPTAVLFLVLALLTGNSGLEYAVYCLLLVVLALIPVAGGSGFYDWRTRFEGKKATIFYKKMALAGLLFLLGLGAAALRYRNPQLMAEGGLLKWGYVALLLAMPPVVVLLGHYGAKLAYQWRKKEP